MPEVTSEEHPNLQVLRADPHQSWTLWPRSCVTLRGAPAPSGWSRALSLQPLCLPGRWGLNQREQGSCCSAKTAWSPSPGSWVGREAPGVQQSGPRRGRGRGGERPASFSGSLWEGRGPEWGHDHSLGGVPRGQQEGSPAEAGWARSLGRACAPSAWSPLEGPCKWAEFRLIVHSRLVFGLSLNAV